VFFLCRVFRWRHRFGLAFACVVVTRRSNRSTPTTALPLHQFVLSKTSLVGGMVFTLYMRASPSQRRVFWLVCAVILMVVTYTHRSGPGHGFTAVTTTQDAEAIAFAEEGDSNNNATCRKCTVKDQILDPHYEIVKHQPKIPATEMVWQIPENCKGVVLLAHGCSHRATDFWPFSTACQRCIGLPEEVYIVKVALSMGLAPVAVSSHFKRCWSEGDVVFCCCCLITEMGLSSGFNASNSTSSGISAFRTSRHLLSRGSETSKPILVLLFVDMCIVFVGLFVCLVGWLVDWFVWCCFFYLCCFCCLLLLYVAMCFVVCCVVASKGTFCIKHTGRLQSFEDQKRIHFAKLLDP